MGQEIERKFLVQSDDWKAKWAKKESLRQGYIASERGNTVRIRIHDEHAKLTIKGPTQGIIREEFEYEIPADDAQQLLKICPSQIIEKIRYTCHFEGHEWTIDEFIGHLKGLVLAEIELSHEKQEFARPSWLGEEVTYDTRYFNANIAKSRAIKIKHGRIL